MLRKKKKKERTVDLHMSPAEAGGDGKGKAVTVWLSIERLLQLRTVETNQCWQGCVEIGTVLHS